MNRHEEVVEHERERVHAAVAWGGVGLARQEAPARLAHLEGVAGEGVLLDDEEGEPLGAELGIRIGAGEERQHVGAPGVGAGVGLGHRDPDHQVARGDRTVDSSNPS